MACSRPGAHSFTNRPVDVTGDFVDNHKVWTIHSMAYDNTIQSGRSALIRYQFHIPADVKGPADDHRERRTIGICGRAI